MSNLISGKEALNHYINDRVSVLHLAHNCLNNSKYDNSWENCFKMPVDDFLNDRWVFKLAPQTIKITIEVPKPFKPNDSSCDKLYYISTANANGYDWMHKSHKKEGSIVWETEEEIIQVRDAFRGALNEN